MKFLLLPGGGVRQSSHSPERWRYEVWDESRGKRKIRWQAYLVFRSWSRIFFSISASVSVSMNGDHCSASACGRKGSSTEERGASLYYVKTFENKKNCYELLLSVKLRTWRRKSSDAKIVGRGYCMRWLWQILHPSPVRRRSLKLLARGCSVAHSDPIPIGPQGKCYQRECSTGQNKIGKRMVKLVRSRGKTVLW